MFEKNIFKILILCLALAQLPFGSFGRRLCRLPSDYTLRQPNPDDKKLPAVLQLDKFIMDAVANFHFVTTLKSKNAFETVIKELQIMPNTESAVQEFQSKILDFEKQYEPCNTAERQKFMASIYPEMMSKYPLKLEDCKNDDERLVVKVLNKFNIHNPRTMFEQDIADFVKIFEEKFQELKEPIKRENVEFSNELNKWFEEMYNTKTDIFDKAQRIIQLPYQPFFATNARNNVFSFQ